MPLIASVSLCLASCCRSVLTDDDGTAMLTIGVEPSHETRSDSPGREESVSSLQVILFRDGLFYASGAADGGEIGMIVDKGRYGMLAFVNDPTDWTSDAEISLEDVLASSSHLSDNDMSYFVMFGHVPSLSVDETLTSIKVTVDRFVSKVTLGKVIVDFSENPYYKGSTLNIRSIYLTNVLGSCPYSMNPSSAPSSSDIWYNRMKLEPSPLSVSSLTADKGLDIKIQDGTAEDMSLVYYAYPNGCSEDSFAETWEPRKTRLVIEASLEGKDCWYHITIPSMKPNSSYNINSCTIRNIGGTSPEEHLELSPLDIRMNVTDWKTGFTETITFD